MTHEFEEEAIRNYSKATGDSEESIRRFLERPDLWTIAAFSIRAETARLKAEALLKQAQPWLERSAPKAICKEIAAYFNPGVSGKESK